MSVSIPLRNDLPFFDLQVPLDGATYTLQFRWNVRASAWFMDVLDSAGQDVILAGLRLVADFPLALYSTGRQPPGVFIVYDTSGQGKDPELTDLGQTSVLYYITQAELQAGVPAPASTG